MITPIPVLVKPVKATLSTPGCFTSGLPVPGPKPVTTLKTPRGKPASAKSRANSSVEAEVCSDGLTTKVQPQESWPRLYRYLGDTDTIKRSLHQWTLCGCSVVALWLLFYYPPMHGAGLMYPLWQLERSVRGQQAYSIVDLLAITHQDQCQW